MPPLREPLKRNAFPDSRKERSSKNLQHAKPNLKYWDFRPGRQLYRGAAYLKLLGLPNTTEGIAC